MRKCVSCGATKKLKGILWDEDEGFKHHAICKSCYFDTCSCEMDGHDVSACLESTWCENHEKTIGLNKNWDDYDYHFKLKNTVELTI